LLFDKQDAGEPGQDENLWDLGVFRKNVFSLAWQNFGIMIPECRKTVKSWQKKRKRKLPGSFTVQRTGEPENNGFCRESQNMPQYSQHYLSIIF
jgi:hypothetical protein